MNQNLSSKVLHRSVISLFVSNIVAFLITGLSYVIYSNSLIPSEFGLYSIALAIGSFGTLVLDGGLKNTIIKSKNNLSKEEEGSLMFLMVISSFLLVFILITTVKIFGNYFPNANQDYKFLASFSGIYLLSYPWLVFSTASLERKLSYTKLSWIESIGMIIEKAFPALFILYTNGGIYSFIWGLIIGRSFRMIYLNCLDKPYFCIPSWNQFKGVLYLLREGAWLQSATGASLIRDNLHIFLVGTMFGKEWVGYYAWGLQLCTISSQAFVQISARISIPMFAQAKDFQEIWRSCLYQMKLLTVLTGPILVVMLIAVPSINENLFHGKWSVAIILLPLLFARMIPGLATTPVGAMLMVYKGGRTFAKAIILWTILEIVIGAIFVVLIGPTGLGISYAIVVWLGLWIFLISLGEEINTLATEVCKLLLQRTSLFISIFLSLFLCLYYKLMGFSLSKGYGSLVISVIILIFSYFSEREFRVLFKKIPRFLGVTS